MSRRYRSSTTKCSARHLAIVVSVALAAGCSGGAGAPGNSTGSGGSGATAGTGGTTATGGAAPSSSTGGSAATGGAVGSGGAGAGGGPGTGGRQTAGSGGVGGGQGGPGGGSSGSGGGLPTIPDSNATAHLDDLKRAFTQLQFGIWHHFGILTYTGTWAQANLPIDDFNPGTTLNPRQWAAAAKSAGAKFGVLTTRHHDGFALWPSKASNFNVGHISWLNGQGDVVKQFVDGYRAEGLLPAFYYSIWDTTHPVQGNLAPEAIQYLTTQLTELMSNYGPIPLLIIDGWSWMMGHRSAEAWYIHNLVKSLQPDILIVDHEGIQSPYDEDLVMYEEPRGVFAPAGNTWAAVQGQKVNQHGGNDWFWARNIQGYLTVQQIVDNHINTLVPRYTTFILNCPPNNKGLLDDAVVQLLADVGTYRQSHPAAAPPPLPTQGVQNSNPYYPVSATASSGAAANAIDGKNDIGRYALWQSSGNLPQWIEVDLGAVKSAGFVGYLPPYEAGSAWSSTTGNCSGTPCAVPSATGLITSYEIDVSTDGTTYTKATTGTWSANGKLQGASFDPVQARYVRLIALAVNAGTIAAATEIEVGGPQALTLRTPTPADWGH